MSTSEKDSDLGKKSDESGEEPKDAKKRPRDAKSDYDIDLKFPKSTIKRMMKINTEVNSVSYEGVAAACLAAELFLKYLAEESCKNTQAAGRKVIKLEDISAAVESNENLIFLKDAFGPIVKHEAP